MLWESDEPYAIPDFIIIKKEGTKGIAKDYPKTTLDYEEFDYSKDSKPKKESYKF